MLKEIDQKPEFSDAKGKGLVLVTIENMAIVIMYTDIQ